MAVEDDELLSEAQRLIAKFRRSGISADMIANGSVRKRYDKATKIDAYVLMSMQLRDGLPYIKPPISAVPNEVLDKVVSILTEADPVN